MINEDDSDELFAALSPGPAQSSAQPLEQEFRERLRAVKSVAERRTIAGLARELRKLPLDQTRAALESLTAIAGVSLRAGVEFLRAVPQAARVLAASELRSWGEMGRRIALSDIENSISFFVAGVNELHAVPAETRPLVFQICLRQMTLSSAVATETLHSVSELAGRVNNAPLFYSVLEIAAEISRRSAKHSADFLAATPRVVQALDRFQADPVVAQKVLALAAEFASRAGGIASDAWSTMPTALADLDVARATRLLERTGEFLERGGGVALHVLSAGSDIQRTLPEIFDEWIELLLLVAKQGNASLVAFVRGSPRFIAAIAVPVDRRRAVELATRTLRLTREVAAVDAEAALACFRSSAAALHTVSIEQFEEWVRSGLGPKNDARARRSYFAIETRHSYDTLHTGARGLPLDSVQSLLRLYIEALTGREIEIAPLAAVPVEARITDGRTIHLPSLVAEFGDDDLDFRLYKVLAAHAAGQIEFGTHERGTPWLRAAYSAIAETYAASLNDARDAFSLADEIVTGADTKSADTLPTGEVDHAPAPDLSEADYRSVLQIFPHPQLARRIFGTLENGRIDRRLRRAYRGLSRDLDFIREHLLRNRPRIIDLPSTMVPFELLFRVTLCGDAGDDARQFYAQIVSELETIVTDYTDPANATVADTLLATSRVFSLFKSIAQDEADESQTREEPSAEAGSAEAGDASRRERSERSPQLSDARELFSAWNDPNAEGDPEEIEGAEAWTEAESLEQTLEEGEVAFNYDEWDRDLTDHRLGWCRVIEKRVKHGDSSFVEKTRERHKGVISSIRHQFQLMKPEELSRVFNELDGEEFDLNAVIDYVIDRRADGHQSERLYMKRLRRRRDVAVSFLLDQSSSTARTIGRHPLQPYTHPGRRIIEIEKEGLVLMSEALEAVGDAYSINGFTSEGRRNVKFYVVKDFDEQYADEVKRRIGGITYQNNTRLGAAIRHATARLAKQEARTHLLIVLSDGRPYDHDYGDARYAREDTREALRQAKIQGITPFCITIDRESEAVLRDLYGEIGYTIIDDVLSLPERLPGIYRRLTN
jgi:nitric oxide reductase NorD protein